MKLPIYLDYNATTPVDPRVLDRMVPYFTEHFGNASSKGHPFGWAAGEAVQQAREEVAALLGAAPEEIYFTGGATESINTAIKGIPRTYARKGNHIITVATEHKAVLQACKAMEKQGVKVTVLPVDASGLIDVQQLEEAMTEQTILVSVMWANNETGVLQPMEELAQVVRPKGVLLMTDGTQAYGKIPVSADLVDIFTCTAHKLYGPKGIGALYIRRRNPRVRVPALIDGGSQEGGLRGGTLNTPGIVGLGAAAAVAYRELEIESSRLRVLRDTFEERLQDQLEDVQINGAGAPRLPHVSNLTLIGIPAAKVIPEVRDLAMSTGSACSTGTGAPSHVLKAMGLSDEDAYASLRISFGRFSTEEEMDLASDRIISAAKQLRETSAKIHA